METLIAMEKKDGMMIAIKFHCGIIKASWAIVWGEAKGPYCCIISALVPSCHRTDVGRSQQQ